MKWTNEITEKLGIEYPIIQAPMFGVTTPEMVASATESGCLGTLPLGDLPAQKCIEIIRTTKQLVNKPFAVNIFANAIPPITPALKQQYIQTKQFIEHLAKQHHLQVTLPTIEQIQLNSYHEQIEAIIQEHCKIVGFTFGSLDPQSIALLKAHGTILIGTCTTVQEALILEQAGIDIICVQGIEAGGHRGTFTKGELPKIGGLSLLSQVYDRVKIPIIYAGGIYDAKTLLATKTLGAQGFQVGSLLLGTKESGLKNFEKERLFHLQEEDIVLTKSFSGHYARGIKNIFIDTLEQSQYILPYPYQNKLTYELRKVAKINQNLGFVSIWVGQSLHPFSTHSTAYILKQLIETTNQYHKT